MFFDAVILAGGRSARLGGVPKSSLVVEGESLLDRALRAASKAQHTVVVGPDPGRPLPWGTLLTREDPPFTGPASGIAAGLAALASATGKPSPWTLVLACDMPNVRNAVGALLDALTSGTDRDGVMAVSPSGRKQPLAGIYRSEALRQEAASAAQSGTLTDGSVFALLARLDLLPVTVPEHSTADVDTWDDAAALGVAQPSPAIQDSGTGRQIVKSQEETLEEWCRTLLRAFELEDVDVDVNRVLSLAGVAAHSVVRPAAPLTTFIAGFAAGMATGSGQAPDTASMDAALALARKLSEEYSAPETVQE
ncbi:NTP transferase domain-containing protein [Arthrobacter sp. M4]|uniref:NTP transferase domain-containing protein n=1 Tax=Arthrobacter sp. M4 TaxID=218160 RepID=UPI001CDBA071|nr:NTP transferase domain-containing protein [Arthrobacter sp. M4]MCA4133832.1 molybdenum cofactor guanylyltransferase [Arthrobacter sp. M4]